MIMAKQVSTHRKVHIFIHPLPRSVPSSSAFALGSLQKFSTSILSHRSNFNQGEPEILNLTICSLSFASWFTLSFPRLQKFSFPAVIPTCECNCFYASVALPAWFRTPSAATCWGPVSVNRESFHLLCIELASNVSDLPGVGEGGGHQERRKKWPHFQI